MKKLTKIRLINWHYLSNETIEVKNNILLTGSNASGKSTLMDALGFILTAGNTSFNIAANDKSKRDLRGYIKCKLGMDEQEYLRDGDVTGHVALEFYDESKESYFVVGSVIDAFGILAPVKTIFYSYNGKINDEYYINDNVILSTVEFRKQNKDFSYYLTKKEAKRSFRNIFGGINEDYFKLLPKSLAFKPISDVKEFIYSNILEEKEIDVSNIKDAIRSYKELESTVKIIRTKINDLTEMQKIDETLSEISGRKNYLNYLMRLFDKEKLEENNEAYDLEINTLIEQKSFKHKDIINLEKEADSLHERSLELYKLLSDNESYKREEYIIKQIEKTKKTIDELSESEDSFLRDVASIKDSVTDLRRIDNKPIYQEISNLSFVKLDKTLIESTRIKVIDLDNRLKKVKADINKDLGRIEVEKSNILNEMNSVSAALKNSENRKLNYDSKLLGIRNDIASGLKALYGYDISVHFFAELIEITNPEWADTVEVFLGNRRFDIIVEPRYYKSALQIFSRIKNKYNRYGVGLVNTTKISIFDNKFQKNSIATILTSENEDARRYINMTSGSVIMVDSELELDNFNQSITNDLLIYRGFTVRNLNPHIDKPFIGKNALGEQAVQLNKRATEIKARYLTIRDQIVNLESEVNLVEKLDFNKIIDEIDNAHALATAKDNLRNFEKERARSKDASYEELEDDYHKVLNTIKNIDGKKIVISEGIGSITSKIEQNKISINNNIEKISSIENDLRRISLGDVELEEKASLEYRELKKNMNKSVINNYMEKAAAEQNNFDNLADGLLKRQFEYINKYNSNYSVGLTEMPKYMNELQKLEKSELIKYESRVRVAREEAEVVFKEDFLSKLRNNILTAEKEISKINETLSSIKFGNDKYEFIFPRSDEFSTFYDMVTSELSPDSSGIFAVDFQNKYDKQLEELFETLQYDETNSNGAMNKFTDYRTYMDYDIKITNNEGQTLSYSKVFKEKSGGETQVPFYVAMIASFVRVFTKNKSTFNDSIGVVLFDEVFDKMDSSRMQSMMEFIDSMPLQVVIACPPQRMNILSEYADTTLVMLRQNNHAMAYPMTKKEIDEFANSDSISIVEDVETSKDINVETEESDL